MDIRISEILIFITVFTINLYIINYQTIFNILEKLKTNYLS